MTVVAPTPHMTVDAFIPWAMAQPSGRYELVRGAVVAMAPERARRARAKFLATRALSDALAAAGLPCEAYVNGLGVRIDDHTLYEPNALVRCGAPLDGETVEIDDPVVVVEVASPSTRDRDAGAKLADYFRLDSVAQYLIVDPDARLVVHHRRLGPDEIATRIVRAGVLTLDPPGVTLALAELLPAA